MRPAEQTDSLDSLGWWSAWLSGSTLVVGLVIAVMTLVGGRKRRAFQALCLPVLVLSWAYACMEIAGGSRGAAAALLRVSAFLSPFLLPLALFPVLRALPWPKAASDVRR